MAVEKEQLKKIVEGALFASDKPLTVDNLARLFFEGDLDSKKDISEAIEELQGEYDSRGVELKEVSSGFRFQVRTEVGEWVSRLWDEKPPRYSRALLETLALVAYRQPITRGEIEGIRGVSVSSHIMRSLLERDWVRVVGHRDVPGRPAMYATTRGFLDYFNLTNLNELPSLAEIRDFDKINEELELLDHGSSQAVSTHKADGDVADTTDLDAKVNDQENEIIEEISDSLSEDRDSSSLGLTFKELADRIPNKEHSEEDVDTVSEEAEIPTDV
ncbi:MAG: SMC-Scp complex subunit ScpB [Pseudomonadales bacterium]|nr:SMC-Scp complex subunit ScpB [Pseudomonadales bacterium]